MKPPESDLVMYRRKSPGPYRIRWIYADGVEGLTLGADLPEHGWTIGALPEEVLSGNPDHRRVTLLLSKQPGVFRDKDGYGWESLWRAENAVRAARAALWGNACPSPLPYEEQALCNGWTPPIGWMPRKK